MLRKLGKLRPVAAVGALAFILPQIVSSLTFWGWYWFIWFFGLFLIPELYWVFNGPDNTLSDNTWRFEGLNFQHPFDFALWTPVHWAFAVVYTLLVSWLWIHLLFGQLR